MLSKRVLLVFVVALLLASLAGTSLAASVTPTVVEGNPTCVGLGYAYGYKVNAGGAEDNPWGTWPVGPGTITVAGPNQFPGGMPLDWSSTFGIDAVIVKGGNSANVYVYNPELFGDSGLVAPLNQGGNAAALSHVEFCYDYELTVSKDANATYTRTYTWDIFKGPDGTYNGFTGDSFVHQYTVSVNGYEQDSNFAASGTITISNPDPGNAANITSVTDSVDGSPAAVDCGVAFPYSLPAGGTLYCGYSAGLLDKATRTNTATVTTSGAVGGGQGTAQVIFGAPTTIVGHPSVNVTDTNGESWVANGSASWQYFETFNCNADEGQHVNTATISETGQSASATVTVNCYALNVTKDVTTSFMRFYTWVIEKTGDETELILSVGQQALVNYDVVVNASYIERNWLVYGTFTVHNPSPIAATVISVNDVVSPDIAASVSCGGAIFPYTLHPNHRLVCTYNVANLPDGADRLNTATATLQNNTGGTTDFTGTALVSFANAMMFEADTCIDLTDTLAGSLGTVCHGETPKTIEYSLYVGPYATCGEYTLVNVVSYVTNDDGPTGSDSHTVNVSVPCDAGCSLTPGYWKTHSKYGPAPYDDTWALKGEDTPFFLSGKSWYAALWTPPAGNAYWILAHAYIAAELNDLNGADTSAISAELAAAKTLFETISPAGVTRQNRKQFTDLASTIDNYNNGLIGPGHCSE